jgi:hypothetical protein
MGVSVRWAQMHCPSLRLQNIALFSCLYTSRWNGSGSCDCSYSYMTVLLTTMPGIWRMLQCLRCCWDTQELSPGLPNGAKYMTTILMHASLGMYRIHQTDRDRDIFVLTATFHGLYTSFWDMYYDWKLGVPDTDHRFLRQTLAYKKVWIYYAAIAINPILRFSWVLYAVVPVQHQRWTVVTFGVSVGEVFRRGLWLLIRVESEFCARFACRPARGVVLVSSSPEEHAEGDGVNKHESIARLGRSGIPVLRIDAPTCEGALQPAAIWMNRDRWISIAVPDIPAPVYRPRYK